MSASSRRRHSATSARSGGHCFELAFVAAALLFLCGASAVRHVAALRFDVGEAPTCLVYAIDSAEEIPRVEVRYVSSFASNPSTEPLASQLSVTTLDPHRREANAETIPARSEAGATWRVVRVMHRRDERNLGRSAFTLAGEYSLCFRRVVRPQQQAARDQYARALPEEAAYVEMLVGDARSKAMLEKQTVTTRGEEARYTGAVRSARRSAVGQGFEEGERGGEGEESLSEDEAEEYAEWIDEIQTQLTAVNNNFGQLHERRIAFAATSNSLFTRVWIMAVLTLGAMGATMAVMFAGLRRTLIEKKLV